MTTELDNELETSEELDNTETLEEGTETQDAETQLEKERWTYQQSRADKAEAELRKLKEEMTKFQTQKQPEIKVAPANEPLKPPTPPIDFDDPQEMFRYQNELIKHNEAILTQKTKYVEDLVEQVNRKQQALEVQENQKQIVGTFKQYGADDGDVDYIMNHFLSDKVTPLEIVHAAKYLRKLNPAKDAKLPPESPSAKTNGMNEHIKQPVKTTIPNSDDFMRKMGKIGN